MATFPNITQAGNSTLTWINSGGNITNHEVFTFTLKATHPNNNTGTRVSNVTTLINPNRYLCTLTVAGPQAVTGNFESTGI
jgi:hypothetical protein